jgi:hypothetical protein
MWQFLFLFSEASRFSLFLLNVDGLRKIFETLRGSSPNFALSKHRTASQSQSRVTAPLNNKKLVTFQTKAKQYQYM